MKAVSLRQTATPTAALTYRTRAASMLLAATQILHERPHTLPDEPITAKTTEKFGWPSAGPDDAIHTVGFG